jgi:hypothetical protein
MDLVLGFVTPCRKMLQDRVDDIEWQSWQQVLATLLHVGQDGSDYCPDRGTLN